MECLRLGQDDDLHDVTARLAGGLKRTAEFAAKHGKTFLHISHSESYDRFSERLAAFAENDIKALNVVSSRGSKESEVAGIVKDALEEAFYPGTFSGDRG
jgi:alkanesulfonate monooxygenase SsuD/methylene tetrahydromethanopterin reductase-like flavin-dependent oxidoreductase (luciferase family)